MPRSISITLVTESTAHEAPKRIEVTFEAARRVPALLDALETCRAPPCFAGDVHLHLQIGVPVCASSVEAVLEYGEDESIVRRWSVHSLHGIIPAAKWAGLDTLYELCCERIGEVVALYSAREHLRSSVSIEDVVHDDELMDALGLQHPEVDATAVIIDVHQTPDDDDDMFLGIANLCFGPAASDSVTHVVQTRMRDLPSNLRALVRSAPHPEDSTFQGYHSVRDVVLRRAAYFLNRVLPLDAVENICCKAAHRLRQTMITDGARYRVIRHSSAHPPPICLRVDDASSIRAYANGQPPNVYTDDSYTEIGSTEDEERDEERGELYSEDGQIEEGSHGGEVRSEHNDGLYDSIQSLLSFMLHRVQNFPCYMPNRDGDVVFVTNIQRRAVDVGEARRQWTVLMSGTERTFSPSPSSSSVA